MDIKQIGPALAGACIVEPQSLNQGFGILADDVTFCYYTRKPPLPMERGFSRSALDRARGHALNDESLCQQVEQQQRKQRKA